MATITKIFITILLCSAYSLCATDHLYAQIREYHYSLSEAETQTGWPERVIVTAPDPLPTGKVPVLALFHGFGGTEQTVLTNTNFQQEAVENRGWILLSMLGGHQFHFSSELSKQHTKFAFDILFANFSTQIDRSRIYGVGFSMGGGAVLNYAASNIDPQNEMFAAVFAATANLSPAYSYQFEPSAHTIYQNSTVFGGTPTENPFLYRRSSVLEALEPMNLESFNFDSSNTQLYDSNNSLYHNLTHIPVGLIYESASNGQLLHLKKQTHALASILENYGNTELFPAPEIGHSWDVVQEAQVCDFLSGSDLKLPTAAKTLAYEDGKQFYFDIKRDTINPDQFTRYVWRVLPNLNELHLFETKNLSSITVDLEAAQLSAQQLLTIKHHSQDSSSDTLSIKGFTDAPTAVYRNNTEVNAQSWSYNSLEQKITLLENGDGGYAVWKIQP